ncbi:MAG: ribosome recycling factor [Candidatus Omnitrophica bacterium]|nr:ribosome recycling factor [Candidatus Omnitrophota bacterium]
MQTLKTTRDIEKEVAKRMDKSIEAVQREFKSVHAGTASTTLVDHVTVSYYGQPTPIKGLASVSTPDHKTIIIQPWDVNVLEEIVKSLQSADLGTNPVNDGKCIRIQMPQLTAEKRQELTKQVRRAAEEGRISVRNCRHEAIEAVKKLEKEKKVSEDDSRMSQKHIQKITDDHTKKIDDTLKGKETELQTV